MWNFLERDVHDTGNRVTFVIKQPNYVVVSIICEINIVHDKLRVELVIQNQESYIYKGGTWRKKTTCKIQT
jgi:hypothetical protein